MSAQRIALLVSLALLAGCAKTPEAAPTAPSPSPQQSLQSIAAADPAKYGGVRDMNNWQNPHLIVRTDGIGLVDLTNHEIHILQPEQVPAQLASLPPSAWPYGRVVLVTEAATKDSTDQMKADLRKNRGLLAGTLKELNVQVHEP